MKGKPIKTPVETKKVNLIRCIYLNLDIKCIDFDRDGLDLHSVTTVKEVQDLLQQYDYTDCCVIIGLSRSLMNNYLAIASLLFSPEKTDLPMILVTHSSNKIADYKAFLFGKKPYPIHRIDRQTILNLWELKNCYLRTFQRIPVEFVAFADPGRDGDQIPVVCKNISWGGAYFETRAELDFTEFRLVLRSKLHTIEIPCRIMRRESIAAAPRRHGYGVQFLMPLPLTLIHYMYAKYLKDGKSCP